MAYTLGGTAIKAPNTMQESNDTQVAQVRTLDGDIKRDFFGNNKRVWNLSYTNCEKADYDTINTIYQSYLSTGTAKTWVVTETNYAVASTNVHVNLQERGFSVSGTGYLSDFTLILTEA